MIEKDVIISQLQEYILNTSHKGQRDLAERTLALINSSDNFWKRKHFNPGHVTVSAFVVNSDRTKTLLIHHKKHAMWFQPGGHIDPGDVSVVAAILREAREETGLPVQIPEEKILDVDIHSIPEYKDEPEHLHFDVRMLAIADESMPVVPEEGESKEFAWFPLKTIEEHTTKEDTIRMAQSV